MNYIRITVVCSRLIDPAQLVYTWLLTRNSYIIIICSAIGVLSDPQFKES